MKPTFTESGVASVGFLAKIPEFVPFLTHLVHTVGNRRLSSFFGGARTFIFSD